MRRRRAKLEADPLTSEQPTQIQSNRAELAHQFNRTRSKPLGPKSQRDCGRVALSRRPGRPPKRSPVGDLLSDNESNGSPARDHDEDAEPDEQQARDSPPGANPQPSRNDEPDQLSVGERADASPAADAAARRVHSPLSLGQQHAKHQELEAATPMDLIASLAQASMAARNKDQAQMDQLNGLGATKPAAPRHAPPGLADPQQHAFHQLLLQQQHQSKSSHGPRAPPTSQGSQLHAAQVHAQMQQQQLAAAAAAAAAATNSPTNQLHQLASLQMQMQHQLAHLSPLAAQMGVPNAGGGPPLTDGK